MIKTLIAMGVSAAIAVVAVIGLYEVATPSAHVEASTAGTVLVSGDFVTPDPTHPAAGGFEIVSDGKGGRFINLDSDFSIVAAPDPHIRVNGKVIAKVVNVKGAQTYPIPNFVGEIKSVHAWCEIANVSLGNTVLDGDMMMDDMKSDMMKDDMMKADKMMEADMMKADMKDKM